MGVEFLTRTFWWNRRERRFELDEPATLTEDVIDRKHVTEYLLSEGWVQMSTQKLAEETECPGVTDLWFRNRESPTDN